MADDPAWPPGAGDAGPPQGSPPFAGRQSQLAHLAAEYEHVRDGSTRLTLVHGEAGIGKSRLVAEFSARIEPTGPAALFGRCDQERLIPYQPIVEAVRDHLASEGGDASLANLGPEWLELRRLLPGDASADGNVASSQLSPATQRYQLFESVVTLLSIASSGRPLVIVLEDLHWADQPLLMLLRHLLRTRRLRGVYLVATYRESDLQDDHPLHGFLADTGHDDACSAISLDGLSEAAVAELFDAVVPGPVPVERASYLRNVFKRTEGNPFFVLEMFRHLRKQGSGWTVDWDSELPGGVRELVTVRMRNLPGAVREVLGTAAVIGHHFDFTLLQRVMDAPGGALLDLLGIAEQAGHVGQVASAPGEFRFAHAISRDAVYATLSPGDRASIHHRVGVALESLGPGRTALVPEQLAYHFEHSAEAGDAERAVRYARIAGERALNAFAFEDAVAFFESALRAQERMAAPSQVERCELLLQLGRAQAGVEGPAAGTARGRDIAVATFSRAAMLARELGSPQLMVRAAVDGVGHWLEGTGSYGTLERGLLQLHEDVLSWLPDGTSPERLSLLVSLHGLYQAAVQPENRQRCMQEIESAVTHVSDPRSRASGELAAAVDLVEMGQDRQAVEAFDSCLANVEARFEREVISRALFLRMVCVTRLGDVGEMRSTARRVHEFAEENRDSILRVWAEYLYAGGFAHMSGDMDSAIELNRKAAEAAAEIGSRHIILSALSQRSLFLNFLANWDSVRTTWEAWLRNPGSVQRGVVAWSSAHAGYFAVANAQLNRFESGEVVIPSDRHRVHTLSQVSEAAALAGRVQLAGKLYGELLPAEGLIASGSPAFVHGPVGRPLGMLATVLQRWDSADMHFEAAIHAAERMQHRPAVADTTFEYARSLLARNQWGERGRARDMAGFAEAEAQFMGYARLEADAARLLDSMGRGGYPAGLSEREVAVLRLMSRGLSNREVADEFVVSPATVASHVRHILNKTGSANRAQAVAFAVRHELT